MEEISDQILSLDLKTKNSEIELQSLVIKMEQAKNKDNMIANMNSYPYNLRQRATFISSYIPLTTIVTSQIGDWFDFLVDKVTG